MRPVIPEPVHLEPLPRQIGEFPEASGRKSEWAALSLLSQREPRRRRGRAGHGLQALRDREKRSAKHQPLFFLTESSYGGNR